MYNEETNIQKSIVRFIRAKYPDLIFTCAPAGIRRGTKLQRILNAKESREMGYQKHYPDLAINEPNKSSHGLFFEVKTKTGRVDIGQTELMQRLISKGYTCRVVRSVEDAERELKIYFSDI